ncbi:hypothetical protein V1478_017761 [Vespula squamosa]|uniref:Uncharacterized protein n=1 Tax=Vespula squamosa TaxID=30214 RepID=A0ABD1ZXA0_VESSQ
MSIKKVRNYDVHNANEYFLFAVQISNIFIVLSIQRDIAYFLKSYCKQMLYHRVRMRQIIHLPIMFIKHSYLHTIVDIVDKKKRSL